MSIVFFDFFPALKVISPKKIQIPEMHGGLSVMLKSNSCRLYLTLSCAGSFRQLR